MQTSFSEIHHFKEINCDKNDFTNVFFREREREKGEAHKFLDFCKKKKIIFFLRSPVAGDLLLSVFFVIVVVLSFVNF